MIRDIESAAEAATAMTLARGRTTSTGQTGAYGEAFLAAARAATTSGTFLEISSDEIGSESISLPEMPSGSLDADGGGTLTGEEMLLWVREVMKLLNRDQRYVLASKELEGIAKCIQETEAVSAWNHSDSGGSSGLSGPARSEALALLYSQLGQTYRSAGDIEASLASYVKASVFHEVA